MAEPFIITIDGPGGVGKSSIAKRLAEALNISMLDTGAMYRTLGIKLGSKCVDMTDDKIEQEVRGLHFTLDSHGSDARLLCNKEDVYSMPIRTEQASRMASIVAKFAVVRRALQENQREMAQEFSLLAEGRDMGTKVFPDAQCKIFLDGSAEIRAKRRYNELVALGEKPDYETLFQNLYERDIADRARSIDPLLAADDAFVLDTSHLTLDQVFQELYDHIQSKISHTAFTHIDKSGNACMVDVGNKDITKREAVVGCKVNINDYTLKLLKEKALPKGDALAVAKVAGILAAKQTSTLIPMCHSLALTYVDIEYEIIENPPCIEIYATTHTSDRTGVEIEALVAAQITAAALYDMCKAVQKDITITDCKLIKKTGGKSDFIREERY